MERYKNLSGKSGVSAFETQDESIIVQFKDGYKYLYGKMKPGLPAVDKMKTLAAKGEGLQSYINTHIKKNYERKFS